MKSAAPRKTSDLTHGSVLKCAAMTRRFTAIATVLLGVVSAAVWAAERSDKWWWDNLGGPSSSQYVNLDQINKSNVNQLQVAWFYPYATSLFNPIAVEDVIYTLGRDNALIALDATTGKEIWIHEGLAGINARGINYWQSEDGKDKRLLFSINSFLQAIDATNRQVDSQLRDRRHRRPAHGSGAGGRHEHHGPVEQSRQGVEEPADPGIGARRGFHLAAWRHPRV